MRNNRNGWLALTALSLFALSCSLLGQVASEIGDQVSETVEEQLQDALEAVGGDDISGKLTELMDQVSEENIAELIEDFTEGEWTRVDVPLPPDANVFGAYSGELGGELVILETSMTLDETEEWVLARLEENGWRRDETDLSVGQTRVLNFSKDDEKLVLAMTSSEDSGKTDISITVFSSN